MTWTPLYEYEKIVFYFGKNKSNRGLTLPWSKGVFVC